MNNTHNQTVGIFNMPKFSKKWIVLLFTLLFCKKTDCFIYTNNPLRNIAINRALQSSVVEIVTLNLFDQSQIMQHVLCNCEENKFLGLYMIGSIYFGFSFWKNMDSEMKLSNIPVYSISKKHIKQVLLLLFLILGKDINSVF